MSRMHRVFAAATVLVGVLAACSEQSPVTAPGDASFAKSGTAPSGGGGGGSSGGGSVDTTSTPTPPTGEPIAPTYTGKITRIGEVPVGMYYGKPSSWDVNGYRFESVYTTNYKAANGPFVLGACVTVNFYMGGDQRIMQEIKTLAASRCQ